MNTDKLRATLTGQLLALGFLNKVFYERPDDAFLKIIVAEELFSDWPLTGDHPSTRQGLSIMRQFASDYDAASFTSLNRDYARLFVGPDHLLAPPWESVYLGREHLLFEEETYAVREFYARFGLQTPSLNVEPDDHFALELAFVAHCCTLALEALERGDDEALDRVLTAGHEFLSEHLLRWAPAFLERVIERSQSDFYRGAAYLARGCLAGVEQTMKPITKRKEVTE